MIGVVSIKQKVASNKLVRKYIKNVKSKLVNSKLNMVQRKYILYTYVQDLISHFENTALKEYLVLLILSDTHTSKYTGSEKFSGITY